MRSPQWSKASEDYFLNEIIRLQAYIGGQQRNEFLTLDFPSLENLERPRLALAWIIHQSPKHRQKGKLKKQTTF
jgi:hypothetical protein